MHKDAYYEVKTHWGHFRLDEAAYRDYLAGKLWIGMAPGGPQTPVPVEAPCAALLSHISGEALRLRDIAAKNGLYDTLRQLRPGAAVPVPYKPRMSELSIDELNLSVRSSNGLMRSGASTFGKLSLLIDSERGLRGVRNLGAKSEKEISIAFITACYRQLDPVEKAAFWQSVIDESEPSDFC